MSLTGERRKIPMGAQLFRALTVDAVVDPRPARKFLLGQRVSAMTEARMRAAMARLGIAHLAPPSAITTAPTGGTAQ